MPIKSIRNTLMTSEICQQNTWRGSLFIWYHEALCENEAEEYVNSKTFARRIID